MSRRSEGGSPAGIALSGTAPKTGRAGVRRVLIALAVLGLWLFAWRLISTAPLRDQGILVYRVDVNEIVAYPRSDAAMDYLNAMAIRSGDGWVNWRVTNRWSVYRPGWGGFLALLAALTDNEPAAMQRLLDLLLAATAPAFLLLVLNLYRGPGDLLLALAATLAWIARPFFDWQLQHTMMSEGPTILLALLFCLLAVGYCHRRGEWTRRQGLLLGLVAGALSLVRGQSRVGLLLVVLLLLLASLGELRQRLKFFVGLACGVLVVAGPIWLKTSIHLRLPYAGTSYTALYNVLAYTSVGRRVGGTAYPSGAQLGEREAILLYQERVRRGIAQSLERPGETLREGFLHFSRSIHASVATLAGFSLPPPKKKRPVARKLTALYALAGVGLFFAWRRAGPAALAPLLLAVGYFAPTVPFGFYSNRLGMPISWVGWLYIAGALLLVLRLAARRGPRGPELATAASAGEPLPDAVRGGGSSRRLLLLVAGWLVLATGLLLWIDLRPAPAVDVERLFSDERSRRALAASGVVADAGLVEEADQLLNQGVASDRLAAGVAVLPMRIAPGDQPVLQPFSKERLAPAERPYELFYLASPWKRGGRLKMARVYLPGGGAMRLEHGEPVVVVRQPGSPAPLGHNRVALLTGAAVLPTRWAE